MSESPTLRECIESAVGEWMAVHGGGMASGYVMAVSYVDGGGKNRTSVVAPTDQPTHYSMGLARYLGMWYDDDAQSTFARIWSEGE